MSALKLTFPAPLPKNQKDIVCMLLAGRLKDLFKGKLICAELALGDLLKDAAGFPGRESLTSALTGMSSAISGFKDATGYNAILNGVNSALGQIENVFSLGGLCPSPVHAPQIPDLLPQLNANLFGQANNILGALGQLSNPSMCLGGGPGDFGVNWNSMPGDLRNLKAAIGAFKQDPGGLQSTMNAFTSNIKSQVSRMNSEVKRLEQNLADPLGLNDKLNTSQNLQRVKSISDGYAVKDANGILHNSAIKSMVPADIESTIDNGDGTNVKYVTKPVLDYCGDIVGYEKVAVSGDSAYIGWDPNNSAVNTDNPTVNPVAGHSSYTYFFAEENGLVKVYNNASEVVTNLTLSRGIAYRLGFELSTKKIQFYSNSTYTTVWTKGLTYSADPEYGGFMEIIAPDDTTTFVRGELDWAVLIENPTTPNIIYWKTTDGTSSGSFIIDGITVIPEADRTYDVSMAARKATLQLIHDTHQIPDTENIVQYETFNGTENVTQISSNPVVRKTVSTSTNTYNSETKIYNATGAVTSTASSSGINVVTEYKSNDEYNKIIKTIVRYDDSKYLITKRYVNSQNGLAFTGIEFYISTDQTEENSTHCLLVKFDNAVTLLNSSKLPYTSNYSYKLTYLQRVNQGTDEIPNYVYIPMMQPISNAEESKFELYKDGSRQYIRWNLTSNTEANKANLPKNEFIFQTDIEIDPAHLKRDFIDSNPIEYRTYFHFKANDGTAVSSTVTSTTQITV